MLLIDLDLSFLRLCTALCVSIAFLVALLACKPYKRRLDFFMASGCQLLFVCIFIGGIIVRLYEDLDKKFDAAVAYAILGLSSSEEVLRARREP